MNKEIETRAVISDPMFIEIQKTLEILGFVKISQFNQTDIILDKEDASLFKSQQKIRIRIEGDQAELTYKGKFEGDDQGLISKRKEINVLFGKESVSDLILLFKNLGFPVLFQISKERIIYEFNDVHINIDKWPIVGYLLEVEGDENVIEEIIDKFKPTLHFKNYRLKEMFDLKMQETGKTFEELKHEYEMLNNLKLGKIELIF